MLNKLRGRSSGGGSSAQPVVGRTTVMLPPGLLVAWIVYALVIRQYLAHDALAAGWAILVFVSLIGLCAGVYRVMLTRSGDEPSAGRRRLPVALVLAMLFVVGGSTWTLVVGFFLPTLTFRPFLVLLIPGVSWVSVQLLYSVQRAHAQAVGYKNPFEGVKAATAVVGASSITTKDGGVVEADLKLRPGEHVRSLQGSTAEVESMMGVRPGSVQFLPNLDNAGRAKMRYQAVDALKASVPWPHPSVPSGGTLADPIVLGKRASGVLKFWLIGDEKTGRNASLVQMVGMNGAGKSILYRIIALEIMSRGVEARYVYCDGRKASQQPKWLLDGADKVLSTNEEIARFLLWIRDEEAPRREKWLGAHGFAQWEPGCGIEHLTVLCDELASVASDIARLLADLGETLRSLGIVLVAGLQRASVDRWPSSARSQFGTSITLGVKTDDDARMALSEFQQESGACHPQMWQNRKPGMCYIDAPGLTEEEAVEEARTYGPDKELMEEWALYYIEQRTTAGRLKKEAAPRPVVAVREGRTGGTVTMVRRGEGSAQVGDDGLEVDGMDRETTLDELEAEMAAAVTAMHRDQRDYGDSDAGDAIADMVDEADDDPFGEGSLRLEVDADVAAEMATAGDVQLAEAGDGEDADFSFEPSKTPGAAQQYLATYLQAMRRQGVEEFMAIDLAPVLEATGFSAAWLAKWLNTWAKEGRYGLEKIGPKLGYRLAPLPAGERELASA